MNLIDVVYECNGNIWAVRNYVPALKGKTAAQIILWLRENGVSPKKLLAARRNPNPCQVCDPELGPCWHAMPRKQHKSVKRLFEWRPTTDAQREAYAKLVQHNGDWWAWAKERGDTLTNGVRHICREAGIPVGVAEALQEGHDILCQVCGKETCGHRGRKWEPKTHNRAIHRLLSTYGFGRTCIILECSEAELLALCKYLDIPRTQANPVPTASVGSPTSAAE